MGYLVLSLNWWNKYYADGGDFGQMSDGTVDFIVSFASGKTALDVGCGVGNLARQLAARGFTLTAIDPAEAAIKRAREKDGAVDFRVGEITDITGTFDLIACKHVYKFIDDKPAFLQHIKSRLKPDGIFALLTPTLDRIVSGKPYVAVDRAKLLQEINAQFSVVTQRELPGGLLLICR